MTLQALAAALVTAGVVAGRLPEHLVDPEVTA
jgi:hypothetical protein